MMHPKADRAKWPIDDARARLNLLYPASR